MKAWIRRNREYVLAEMTGDEGCDPFSILFRAVFDTMTPESITGWYRNAGILV